MANTTHNSPTSVTYARSLFELAQDQKLTDEIGKDLAGIAEVLRTNPTFSAFLRDPGISSGERTRVVENVLKPNVSPLLSNFLGVLNAHGRLRLLSQIASAYSDT